MSRKKEVERLQTSELAKSNIQRPYIRFDMKRPSGRHPLEVKGLAKRYGELQVIDGFTASVSRGEKIALMGRNGAGKTTLLKSLVRSATGFIEDADRHFDVDGGIVVWGHEVAVGYFAQDHSDSIARGTTAIEWLHGFDPQASQEELRGLLGQMLFSGEDALKPTNALSGGEAARLDLLPANAAEAEFPGARRTHESPGPGIDQRAQHCAAKVCGNGVAGDARSRPDR